MTAVVVAIATLDAISQILFGLLGVTPEELAWIYTLTFFFTLAIVTVASAVMGITGSKLVIKRIASTVSGALSGALLAFIY
ncbi:hypothetical protein [Fischerella thermalis]|uniref:hypothetical protein n=1 Tax=Fischerella thermalis TaxID=372787 RepID=UPI0021551817|nr:hypothetical protein [Fischerella thermalis]